MWIHLVVLLWVCNYIESVTNATTAGSKNRHISARFRAMICKPLALPNGAYVKTSVKSEYNTVESIMLDCKKGFKKIGNPRRMCISGRWTAFPFQCKATRASRTKCTAKCSRDDPAGCPAGHKCLFDGQCGYSCVEQGLQCPPPGVIKNGIIVFESTGYNDTLTYSCKENYTLNGERVRRCTAKKRWEGAPPSCLPDCDPPIVPRYAYIENKKSKYVSGDRVTFKCDARFTYDGIATKMCSMGRWNMIPFGCGRGGCGDPGTPENGHRVGISYLRGKVVSFSCNIGYVLVGSEQRRCLPNNTWSGTQPTCKLCQTSTDLAFILDTSGSVGSSNFEKIKTFVKNVTDFFDIGTTGTHVAVVTYSSKVVVEFNLTAYNSKTSLKNAVSRISYRAGRTYTGDALEMTRTDVFNASYGMRPDKGIPKVAVLLTDGYSDGWGVTSDANALKNQGVEVFCIGIGNYNRRELNDIASDPDSTHVFTMDSFNDLSSRVNNLIPVLCIEGGCGDPGTPENGNKVGISYSRGKEVFFSCNIGYVRVGSEQRRCLLNNTWSGTQPTCKCVSCGPAPTVRNAHLTSTGTNFNATVVYTCKTGYTINGDNIRRCTARGTWSGTAPNCVRSCKSPVLPVGAYVKANVKTEYKTGESITLDCKKGFKKMGNLKKYCISGRWTAFPFQCKATHSCTRTIRASRTRCTAKCSPKDPAGCPAGHKCLCDGYCGYSCVEQGLQCPVPSQVTNGFITYNGTGYKDTVTYGCESNYTLNGDRIRRCTAKKRWSGAAPSCLPDCGQPQVPSHAYIENKKSKYASGDRITFKCDAGYDQEGIATTLCFMGKWNVMPFRCQKGCGDPGTPENGNRVGISYSHGREMFFSCNIGYVRVGSEQRRCLPNNTWSGIQPTCKLVDCGPPKQLGNGTIIGSETTFQKSVSFKCDEGFELDGNPNAICQSDGKWSNEPTCKLRTRCGDPGTPINGIKKGLWFFHGSLVFFSCNFGYKIVGSKTRQCLANKKWSGVQPTCKRLATDCDQPELPYNTYITDKKSRYLHGESVTFKCKKGFLPVGIDTTHCFMGRWSAVPFSCINTKF